MLDALFPDLDALSRSLQDGARSGASPSSAQFSRAVARTDSDVDLLVEFEPQAKPGLIGMAGIEIELSSLLNRRKVDLRTAADLSRHFRDEWSGLPKFNMRREDTIRVTT